jgi:PPM family protein phosphatase
MTAITPIPTPTPTPTSVQAAATIPPKPSLSDVDAFGLTHPGKVRKKNADHFLVGSFHRAMRVHVSSVAETFPPLSEDSRGYVMLVADGVGALAQASEGSEEAIHSVTKYLLGMGEICLQTQPDRTDEVVARLRAALTGAHESLLMMSDATGAGTAATTMTMCFAIWPRMFVIHAGDSRYYRLRDGTLRRLTTDQTMAQVMIDSGAMSRESAEASRLKNVLVSALGSSQLDPQIDVHDIQRGDASLLCTDGLTRHVSDDEIQQRMLAGGSSESICRDLVDLALDRGGVDNVTVVVVKLRTKN